MAKKKVKTAKKGRVPVKTNKSEAELGQQAHSLKVKSSLTILALAEVVGTAYEAYYEPWAKVGAPNTKIPEQKQADKHWQDFLRESGYVFPRHYPLLRTLWMIHRKMDYLKPNSKNLPNSIDAIKKVAMAKLNDKQQKQLMKGLTESHTARDVAALISKVKTGGSELFDELDAAGADRLQSANHEPSEPKQNVLSMASDLIAHQTINSDANRYSEASHNGFLVVLYHLDPVRKQAVEVEVLSDPDLVDDAIKLAHQKRGAIKSLKAA